MALSVDIPEPLGQEIYFLNLNIFQLSRTIIYTIPPLYFTVVFSPIFLILVPVPYLMMRYKIHGLELDIFIIKFLKWKINRKIFPYQEIRRMLSIREEVEYWSSSEGYMGAIAVDGIGIEFYDDESRMAIYNLYTEFLNGLDFPISIYVYSIKEEGHPVYTTREDLSSISNGLNEMIAGITRNIAKKRFILIVKVRYYEVSLIKSDGIRILEERLNYVYENLKGMGLNPRLMTYSEYEDLIGEFI
ncbi:MAG: hypothetical protein ACP5HV_02005 [Thermoplasmata archaeon]